VIIISLYNIILLFILMSGLYVFCSMHKHLLLTLLRIEFLVLSLFLGIFYFFISYIFDLYFILVFLTFAVCEGALGLSILVSLIRCHGNDRINSLSPLS